MGLRSGLRSDSRYWEISLLCNGLAAAIQQRDLFAFAVYRELAGFTGLDLYRTKALTPKSPKVFGVKFSLGEIGRTFFLLKYEI